MVRCSHHIFLSLRSLFFAGSLVIVAGCASVKKAAVNQVADALASGGTTFAADDDPELVRQAVPFSLKLMESLLSENPRHQKLLLATCSGFTQYAFAFVQQDADELEATNYAQSEALRLRAKKLYRRARDYGQRGLEVAHAGWTARLAADPRATLKSATVADVPLLYWTAAAWGSYISASKDDPAAIGEMVQVEALIDRALELDEDWGDGSLHSMLITLEMSRTGAAGKADERARRHFKRAIALARGAQAGPLVTFAESVCVETHNADEFQRLLEQALTVDVNQRPEYRLANLVMQRRARWLLSRKDDLFFSPQK
jgi:predicted anti-sigma-YlaC factor YlaD